jgi:glyoxylase-like metal-dependent hydrolase (beta-lactamase superfamily II)
VIDCLPVRTPTLPPATHTNCYRVGDTVIDPASPWPDEQASLAAWCGPIARILLTHHHPDHVGGVADLVARTGAVVWAHRDAAVPFTVDRRLEDGDVVDTGGGRLRCLHTPGHADGHLAFQLDDSGEVICGDLVAGVGTIVLVPPEGDLEVYLASLSRVGTVATRLWPAHGPPVPGDTTERYIAHRHMRTAQFEAVLAEGSASPQQIAAAVYAGIPGVDFAFAALQVRTHLAWLAARGRALERDGRWHAA